MDIKSFLQVLLAIFLFIDNGYSIRWLSLQHSNLHWNMSSLKNDDDNYISGRGVNKVMVHHSPCAIARRKYGLDKIQVKFCRKSLDTMPYIQKAATLAVDTCQTIFQNRRWNCSSIVNAPYLLPDLTRATREQSYVYAISSAALTFTMARACASGSLYHCTCAGKPNDPPNGNFQWGGCGDNINWGIYFSKKFIDNMEKYHSQYIKTNEKILINNSDHDHKIQGKREIAFVNLHNNKVGRKVIMENLQIQCKCHGVSGSCSIKTCWKGLPSMIKIGEKLLRRYTHALELKENLPDNLNTIKKLFHDQLIYITKSPDYCTKDENFGSFGTVGRKCNVTSTGPESCRQLCCGRGYRTVVEEKIERCQCRYYNCCYVKCKICKSMTKKYECS